MWEKERPAGFFGLVGRPCWKASRGWSKVRTIVKSAGFSGRSKPVKIRARFFLCRVSLPGSFSRLPRPFSVFGAAVILAARLPRFTPNTTTTLTPTHPAPVVFLIHALTLCPYLFPAQHTTPAGCFSCVLISRYTIPPASTNGKPGGAIVLL